MAQKRDDGVGREPATCKKCGTVNDPYPENGMCTECKGFLKGNPYKLQSEDMEGIARRKTTRERGIKSRAKQYIKDAELSWGETPAITQDLAIRFATTKDRHDGELLLQQLDMLKARPKSSEDYVEAEYSIELTADTVEALQESLNVLDTISRN